MSKRSKMSFLIGMAIVLLVVMSGCGSKEKNEEVKPAETAKSTPANTANPASASAKPKEPTPESKLSEISNFMTSSFWNEGFVDITWYVSNGTGNTGKKLDIDFTIERLGKAMEKKAEYDTYIQGLDAKYDNVKQVGDVSFYKRQGSLIHLHIDFHMVPSCNGMLNRRTQFNMFFAQMFMIRRRQCCTRYLFRSLTNGCRA